MTQSKRLFAPRTIEKQLGDIRELRELLESQAQLLKVGMGVLRNGRHLAGLWPLRFSEFCDLVRKAPKAFQACVESDTKACRTCRGRPKRESLEDFTTFECHMGLIDLPAPIFVRNRLFAHLFMGQIAHKKLNRKVEDFLKRRFDDLSLKSAGVTFSALKAAYTNLQLRNIADLQRVDRVLCNLAEVIGSVAESVNTLWSISQLSSDLTPLVDINTGLSNIYRTIAGLLNADSGSVWLAHREGSPNPGFGYATILRPQELAWFSSQQNEELQKEVELRVGEGVAGWVAKHKQTRRCNTATEIAEIPAGNPECRERRKLGSMLGTPIMSEGSLLGVIELGSKREFWFSRRDEQLIEILGRVAANFVRRTKERSLIVDMHGKDTAEEVFRFLEEELPALFGALAATVYRPATHDGKTRLVPAFPETIVKGVGPGAMMDPWENSYDLAAGEGFTGWVGKYQICLRVRKCDCEEEPRHLYKGGRLRDANGNIPPECPRWAGKTRAETEKKARPATGPALMSPVVDKTHRLLAVVRVCEREGKPFRAIDEAFLRNICEQMAICLNKLSSQRESAKQEMARLLTQCTHDFGRDIDHAEQMLKKAQGVLREQSPGSVVFESKKALEKAAHAVRHLSCYVDNITETLRSGDLGFARTREDISIAELVSQVVEREEQDCRKHDISIEKRLDEKHGLGACVGAQCQGLRDSVRNVLRNSIEAVRRAHQRDGKVLVKLESLAEGSELRLRFEDNGPGFGDVCELVNEGRLIPERKRFGSGIALQEVKGFVEDILDGEFHAEDSPEGGAIVTLTFPVKKMEVEDEPIRINQPR